MSQDKSQVRLSLRRRMIFFGAVVVLSIIVVSSFLVNTFIRQSFADLESSYVASDVQRALAALDQDAAGLEAVTADWSNWDETYAYVRGDNPGFPAANLGPETLAGLSLNFAIITDTAGAILFSRNLDLDSMREVPLPDSPYFQPGSALLSLSGADGGQSGLLDINGLPAMVSAQPVLTTLGEGPAVGNLVLGRFLDAAAMARLQDNLQLAFQLGDTATVALPREDAATVETAAGASVIIAPVDASNIAGYAVFPDLFGDRDLVLRLQLPRDIYAEGLRNAIILSASLAGFVAVCLLLLMWVFDRKVLKRVSLIDSFVSTYDFTGQPGAEQLEVSGQDEISRLSGSINGMIGRIDQSQESLRKTGQKYRELALKLKAEYENERVLRQDLEEEVDKRIVFTRALVHELKTPITPVMAALELLKTEALEEKAARLVQSIDRSAANLNKRIDELLDLARAEVGGMEINVAPTDGAALLREVADDMLESFEKSNITLETDIPDDLPEVMADGFRFRQIVVNLLSNSVRFSPSNTAVRLSAEREGDTLVVKVADAGIGISREDQALLFEPYQRRIGDMERLSGLGLGLALSKILVELQGGKIWVESIKGKGSTFGFTVPLAASGEQTSRKRV